MQPVGMLMHMLASILRSCHATGDVSHDVSQVPEGSPPVLLLDAAQLEQLAARMGSVSLTPSLQGASSSLGRTSATPDLVTPPAAALSLTAPEDERTPDALAGGPRRKSL
jgi:hypothetical protein